MSKVNIIQSKTFTNNAAPYSVGTEAGGLLFLSGQVPLDLATGKVIQGDISVTAKRVLENIKIILSENQLVLTDIMKCTIFLTDMSHYAAFNAVYAEYFSTYKPARTCIAVKELPLGANIEIEVIVARH